MSSPPFHHFGFYHGTKKITPLKIRNPSIHPSQIMPSPSGVPFNMNDMPWCYNGKPGQLMEFNAVIRASPIMPGQMQMGQFLSVPPGATAMCQDIRKRKTEPDVVPIPSKLFLTEDVMASHMNNLHLSSEYTTHNIETTTDDVLPAAPGSLSPCSSLDDEMSLGEAPATNNNHHIFMSPQELEERLRKAQRISVCEEVRKLEKQADILPQALLQRIEKPCSALVLWQPPQQLEKLVTKVSEALKEKESKEEEEKVESRRPTNEIGMMMMGIDEPLPDLPDYDADLDFEENNNNVASMGDLNNVMDVEM
ncbi:uncharacterized protein LOC131685945 [Topomyia yanbarensis]|uniref:uncharacterized protein LOC131685945 n=1 Tax=Topomyia yanbarensis TaxID=2498891 RepID=UPI00273CC0E3|nr:uncharacterized protein LOC131685945 [Topomyia yanbarensis]